MGVYFRTDTTRLTFGELWRISSRFPVFLQGCVLKIFGIRPPTRHAVRHDAAIVVVPAEQVPEPARRVFATQVAALETLGARRLFYQTVPSTTNLAGYGAVLLPSEKNAVIVVTWVRTQIGRPPGKEVSSCGIVSQFEDGTFLSTSDQRARFHPPRLVKSLRCVGARPAELLCRHQEALAESAFPAIQIEDEGQAIQLLVDIKCCNFNWQVNRGVWV